MPGNKIISGRTAKFSGYGRGLGYPTANIRTKTKLKDGVYLGRASLAGFVDHPAIIFVGIPTTVGDTEWRLEAHLLDIPDQDYYDQPLEVELTHYVRPNQTFESIEKLKQQMKADDDYARRFFAGLA